MTDFGGRVDLASRKIIDVAIGVLIGWRGCSEREAFDEIVRAVHDTGVGLGSLAGALVDLASGVKSSTHRAEALRVWGDAMPMRPALAKASSN